jgi:hypothetical protein
MTKIQGSVHGRIAKVPGLYLSASLDAIWLNEQRKASLHAELVPVLFHGNDIIAHAPWKALTAASEPSFKHS